MFLENAAGERPGSSCAPTRWITLGATPRVCGCWLNLLPGTLPFVTLSPSLSVIWVLSVLGLKSVRAFHVCQFDNRDPADAGSVLRH
jgi:hypothetical protein